MANLKSSKKDIRRTQRRRERNLKRDNELKFTSRLFLKLINESKLKEAEEILPKLYKAIDKCKKSNRIKARNAARKKSKYALQLNSLQKKVQASA